MPVPPQQPPPVALASPQPPAGSLPLHPPAASSGLAADRPPGLAAVVAAAAADAVQAARAKRNSSDFGVGGHGIRVDTSMVQSTPPLHTHALAASSSSSSVAGATPATPSGLLAAVPATPHSSPAAAMLVSGGALSYHLILKKHKLLPRSFPVEMRVSPDFATLLVSSHEFHPLTLAPLLSPTAGQRMSGVVPTETMAVSVLDLIDVCEGCFDVTPALMEKHLRKTVAGFAPERCFTLFLSHTEHSDKRAHTYAQTMHHHSGAAVSYPIPFYFEASSIELMHAWVRALRWLKDYTAASMPDERRAQLGKLHRHSAIRMLNAPASSTHSAEPVPTLQHAATLPTLTHSQSVQNVSLSSMASHSHSQSGTPSGSGGSGSHANSSSSLLLPASQTLTHSVSSSSAFSFMGDAIKRAFHHGSSGSAQSDKPQLQHSATSSAHTAAASAVPVPPVVTSSPYLTLYAQLRRHQISALEGPDDEAAQQLALASAVGTLTPSPIAAQSRVGSHSANSNSGTQAPLTPFTPQLPSPLHVDVGASHSGGPGTRPVVSSPSSIYATPSTPQASTPAAHASSSSSATPSAVPPPPPSDVLSPTTVRHLTKTELLHSVLTQGQAFLLFPSRSLSTLPEITYLWCTPDLNLIGWGPDRSKRPLHSYPTSCLTRIDTGVQCDIFGLAKWCFSLHLRVSKAQDHPREHERQEHPNKDVPPTPTPTPATPHTPASSSSSVGSFGQSSLSLASSPQLQPLSPMPAAKENKKHAGMRGVLDSIRGRGSSWSGSPTTPTGATSASGSDGALTASTAAAIASAVGSPPLPTTPAIASSTCASSSASSSSSSTFVVSLHLAACTSSTSHLWLFALAWLRDSKSSVSTPFNVQRVAWMDSDLRWGGVDLLGQFGLHDRSKLVQLGSGGMANVYLVQHQSTKQYFALKVFKSYPEIILHEIEIMRSIRHPNCVQYFGCIPRKGGELYVIMEYADAGSLADLLKRAKEKLKEGHIAYILRQVLLALQYLHSLGILHRDIKAANILLTKTGGVKVADFGISAHFVNSSIKAGTTGSPASSSDAPSPSSSSTGSTPTTMMLGYSPVPPQTSASPVPNPATPAPATTKPAPSSSPVVGGSPLWMSPEALRGHELTPAADVWSTGILALEIAEGRPPNSECKTLFAVMHAVLNSPAAPSLLSHAKSYLAPSLDFQDFVNRCLQRDVATRWSVEQLLSHPFVQQGHVHVPSTPVVLSSSSATNTNSVAAGGVVSTARSFLLRSAALLSGSFSSHNLQAAREGGNSAAASTAAASSAASSTSVATGATPASSIVRVGTQSGSNSPYSSSVPSSPQLMASPSTKGALPSFPSLVLRGGNSAGSTADDTCSPAGGSAAGGATASGLINWPPSLLSVPATGSLQASRSVHTTPTHSAQSSVDDPVFASLAANVARAAWTGGLATSSTAASTASSAQASKQQQASRTSSTPVASSTGVGGASNTAPGSTAVSLLVRSAGSTPQLSPSSSASNLFASLPPAVPTAPTLTPPVDAPVPDVPEEAFVSFLQSGTYARAKFTKPERRGSQSSSPQPPVHATGSDASHPHHSASEGGMAKPVSTIMSLLRAVSPLPHHHKHDQHAKSSDAAAKLDSAQQRSLFGSGSSARGTPAVLKKQTHERNLLGESKAPVPSKARQKETSPPQQQPAATVQTLPSTLFPTASGKDPALSPGHRGHVRSRHTRQFSALPKLLPKLTLKRTASMSTVAAFELATASAEDDDDNAPADVTSPRSRSSVSSSSMARTFTSPLSMFGQPSRRHSVIMEGDEDADSGTGPRMDGMSRSVSGVSRIRKYSSAIMGPSAMAREGSQSAAMYGDGDAPPGELDLSRKNSMETSVGQDDAAPAGGMPSLQRDRSYSHSVTADRPGFLKPLQLSSRESLEQSGGATIRVEGSESDEEEPLAVVEEAASEVSVSGNSDDAPPRRPKMLLRTSSSATEEVPASLYSEGAASEHDESDDPFARERRSLYRKGSLTQGDGGGQMDVASSYMISSHGTLIAGDFRLSAQGLHAKTPAAVDGALTARRPAGASEAGKRRPSIPQVDPADAAAASTNGTPALDVGPDEDASATPCTSASPASSASPSHRDHHSLSKDDLFTLGVIGKGQNGAVLKAIHLPSLTRVALKSIYAHDRGTRHQLLHELTAYLHFDSPFLVSFLGAYYAHDTIVLATEYMDQGSLQAFIARNGPLDTHVDAFRQIAYQCIAGLKHMHDRHALHRDIKPDNILMDHSASVKLADFGLLKDLGNTSNMAATFLGTMSYLSPERIMSNDYSYPSDIWSMGLTFRFALTGVIPRQHSDYFFMMDHITKHPPPPLQPSASNPAFDEHLCDFVNGMLRMDMHERYTCDQLLAHPFLLGPQALLSPDAALLSAYESMIPQTQLSSHSDASLWRVSESNLADLELILEVIVKQHLLPELVAARRQANSSSGSLATGTSTDTPTAAEIVSPQNSVWGSSSGSEAGGGSPELESALAGAHTPVAIASTSDGSFTTSMHHHPLSTEAAQAGTATVRSQLEVEEATTGRNQLARAAPENANDHTVTGDIDRRRSLSTSVSSHLSAESERNPLSRAPTLLLPTESDASAEDASVPVTLQPDAVVLANAAAAGDETVVPSTAITAAGEDDAAAVMPTTSSPASFSVAPSVSADETAAGDASVSPPSPSVRPLGLSLRITSHESVEQTNTPAIVTTILTALDDSSDADADAFIAAPPLARPRLGLTLAARTEGADDDESTISTFTCAGGDSLDDDTSSVVSLSLAGVSASPLSARQLHASPLDAGAGMELLQLDAERCVELARQFALTPEQVQSRFLAKQHDMLRRTASGPALAYATRDA